MNIICYDTLPLQKTKSYHVRVCPLAHSPLETSLKATTHFHYFKYGESQTHAHALTHAAIYLQTLQVCENNAASGIRLFRFAGGRAPSGSLVERKVGEERGAINRATLLLKCVALIFPLIPHGTEESR